ncbi:MAG: SOS response-associated peptidase [Pseudomonadota bacterium]
MCGRFATGLIAGHLDTASWLDIERDAPAPDWAEGWGLSADDPSAARLDVMPAGAWPAPSWNVAPTQTVGIVVGQTDTDMGRGRGSAEPRKVVAARWGLVPGWWRKPLTELRVSTFNARSEEAAGKPIFRDAWRHGHCLVPALGYFEWTGRTGAKTPWFVAAETNRPGLVFAGLWAEAAIAGEKITSFTILTTAANEATSHLHPRAPVALREADWGAWLSGALTGVPMSPLEARRTRVVEVARDVGQVRNDRPDLIEAVGLGL